MRVLLVVSLLLAGCGMVAQKKAEWLGYTETCIDGVAYIISARGISAKYGTDSKVVTCKETP